jgi:hypothetical protein
MWMRSCAVCKALLGKPGLWDSAPCQCGWDWQACGPAPVPNHRGTEGNNDVVLGSVAEVVEFYVPSTFRKPEKWVRTEQRGKLIEFHPPTKKSA